MPIVEFDKFKFSVSDYDGLLTIYQLDTRGNLHAIKSEGACWQYRDQKTGELIVANEQLTEFIGRVMKNIH
jgi:hypothetical protein